MANAIAKGMPAVHYSDSCRLQQHLLRLTVLARIARESPAADPIHCWRGPNQPTDAICLAQGCAHALSQLAWMGVLRQECAAES